MNRQNEPDVIVVGAGASGIYAAKLLKENGLRPIVIEAQASLGGRLKSHQITENFHIELGGQWLAKAGQRRFSALLNKNGFLKNTNFSKGLMVYSNGDMIQHLKEKEVPLSLLAKLDSLRFIWTLHFLLQSISVKKPWRDGDLDKISLHDWLRKKLCTSESRKFWSNTFEQGLCCDIGNISALEGLCNAKSLGGLKYLENADHYYFGEGLQNLFFKIARDHDLEILMNEPITQLTQTNDGVRVVTQKREIKSKYVIVTVPPQTYRNIRFEPELPKDFKSMICDYVQGHVTKVIAVYRRPWWRDKGFSGMITSPTAPFDFVIDSSPANPDVGVLVGIVTGPRSKKLKFQTTDQLKEIFTEHIKKSFGFSERPTEFLHFDWNNTKYSMGGYSSRRRIHQWMTGKDCLQKPLERIYFAGTETALEWRGYIEGALESGERQAYKVLSEFNKQQSDLTSPN